MGGVEAEGTRYAVSSGSWDVKFKEAIVVPALPTVNASSQCGANVLRLSGWMNSITLVPSGAIGVRFQSNLPLSSS